MKCTALTMLSVLLNLSVISHAELSFELDTPAPGNLRFSWIHGSISAQHNTDVRIQVHRYNEHTYILRQNPAVHWEAPFMYLLFGEQRALLVDTGATQEAEYFPLRATIDALIDRWQLANQTSITSLMIVHTSAASAQTSGREQFRDRTATIIVEPDIESLQSSLSVPDWPEGLASIDLGGRIIEVIPTPGTSAMALSLYDPYTDLMLTGTTLLPGRVVIRDFDAYHRSLERLLTFAESQPVKWLMGAQIDMTQMPGLDYRLRSNFRPNERALQLELQALEQAYAVTHLINGRERIEVLADFIIMNGVGRGARPWGYPVYTPRFLDRPSLR